MIKLIAFDWNGTLLADTKVAWAADNFTLKKFGLKPISLKRFQESFDIPILKYWQNVGLSDSFLDSNLEKLEKVFQIEYRSKDKSAKLRANSRDCLKNLKKQKISSIAYTNAPNSHVEFHLKRLKITDFFDAILGRKDDDLSHILSRGKQTRLSTYVKKRKLKPKEVISIGDTEEEIEIGKALGYHTVAITGGYNTTARLKKHKPDFLIHNMKELKGIVKKLNNI